MDPFLKRSQIFKLLGDRNRLMILALLNETDLCVCEIVELLQLSQPNVSQHLRKMKISGLLSETKKGLWVIYSINIEAKPLILRAIEDLPNLKGMINDLEQRGLRVCY